MDDEEETGHIFTNISSLLFRISSDGYAYLIRFSLIPLYSFYSFDEWRYSLDVSYNMDEYGYGRMIGRNVFMMVLNIL